ncbi:Hypothetical_protein [Hexamita inflata]|uniref:Hypothetical_protein n=1 Tax=Hexamita inflata TaxID=28002 RepID=A0AA86UVS2_9EUKA|nr:Hypothetical protein HINF_LOCUS44213 [Hexamita inflata]CAI9966611.1 Hypothetical protein HINF_LOCUS54256 [Hexamita inflata]
MKRNLNSKYNLPAVLESISTQQTKFKNSMSFFEEFTCESSIHSASNTSNGSIPNTQLSKMKHNLEQIKFILIKMQRKLDRVDNFFGQIDYNVEVIKRNNKRIIIKIQHSQ